METPEEFFRNKIKEQNPNKEIVTLSQELITAEQGMRWAHEFNQLRLGAVVGQSEQLVCVSCGVAPQIRDEIICSNCVCDYKS